MPKPPRRSRIQGLASDISQEVAEASVEGTFLGFGGMKVSDAEKATLAEIAKSLGRSV